MATVIMVDAVPGYEDSVEGALEGLEPIVSTARFKAGNYDIAVLVSIDDAAELKHFETNELRMVSGLSAFKVVEDPSTGLLDKLEQQAKGQPS